MLEKRYRNIVYFIALTILATIAVQVYWNIKNYQVNKQQIINQILVSFDFAVDKYYNELAKENVYTLFDYDSIKDDSIVSVKNGRVRIKYTGTRNDKDSLLKSSAQKFMGSLDTLKIKGYQTNIELNEINASDIKNIHVFTGMFDSINQAQNLGNKILISLNKELQLDKIDSIFNSDLERKNIGVLYGFMYTSPLHDKKFKLSKFPDEYLSSFSLSSFIPPNSILELRYTDITLSIFKRMIISMILSVILSGIIIGCLLFLLKTIFKQKQLSAIKNDLINNITHEFKTPIATISAALDGVQNFNIIKDVDKTEEYINISNHQLDKLNRMVENLLETASLHTNELNLNKEKVNLSRLLENCTEKFGLISPNKEIHFHSESDIFVNLDKFHFENAINNVLDNALKYGGDRIKVTLKNNREIIIEDNGHGISKNQQEKIFEQFYRIPTGDVHNIKGFGIGLYYTRKIIEKHGGLISASDSKPGKTIINVKLNND